MSDDVTTQPRVDGRPASTMRVGELITRSERDGDTYTLHLVGELDMATADQVHDELERIEAAQPRTVLIDLSGLTFMDSTGIQTVMRTRTRAHTPPYDLALRRGPVAVQRVFELCAVDDLLPFID